MVKVIYNDHLVYKVVIWAVFGISLWKEKVVRDWKDIYVQLLWRHGSVI